MDIVRTLQAGPAYLSEADIPGQQQDEQCGISGLREDQHQASNLVTGCWGHQTKAREARDINCHMTIGHLTWSDKVHTVPSDMSYR